MSLGRSERVLAARRAGFTLVELLITITIIAMMAGMILFAYYSATEAAKEQKTKALIAKLDAILKEKWDSYKTRRVPVQFQDEYYWEDKNGDGIVGPGEFYDPNGNGIVDVGEYTDLNGNGSPDVYPLALRAKLRLDALRDLMRMELPDRWSDVTDDPVTGIPRPSVSLGYKARYDSVVARTGIAPTGEFAGAECLYLIVTAAQAEEGDSRDAIKGDCIQDVDKDGMPEFVDAWGQPIKFLRWAPGFQESELQIVTRVEASGTGSVNITASDIPTTNGSFVGGAMIPLQKNGAFDLTSMFPVAKVMGYMTTSPTTAALNMSGGTTFAPFAPPPTPPPPSAAIMAPDPFDPRRVHAGFSPTTQSFALYPFIYSAGPDKCYGICADFDAAHPLSYATYKANPFVAMTDAAVGAKSMIGFARDDPKEPNFVPNGWKDNIHNHMLGQK